MVKKDLLDILACPSCTGDLVYDEKADTLTCFNRHCPKCGMPVDEQGKCQDPECGQVSDRFVALQYEVKDDIPIMLIYEAQKMDLPKSA
jgi:uncharacterized protein YbaR (Trm112 family)